MRHYFALIAILFISSANIFSQTFDLFPDTRDFALGEANLADTSPSIQNPASFSFGDQKFVSLSYHLDYSKGDWQYNTSQVVSTRLFSNILLKTKYKNWGVLYKSSYRYYNENVIWTAPGTYVISLPHYNHSFNTITLTHGSRIFRGLYFGLGIHLYYYPIKNKRDEYNYDLSLGIIYFLTSRLKIASVYHNFLKNNLNHTYTDVYYFWLPFGKVQRRFDVGISAKLWRKTTTFLAIKNIFKEKINFENQGALETYRSYHAGLTTTFIRRIFLNIGYKYTSFREWFGKIKRYQHLTFGLSYKISKFTIDAASDISNVHSQNVINNDRLLYTESRKGLFSISVSFEFL